MKVIKDGQGISELTRLADSGGSGIGSTSNALDVYIQGGSSAGTEYAEGATATVPTGTVILVEGPSDTFYPLLVDASKHLQVDIAADSVGIGGGVLYASGDTPTVPTGTMIMFQGAANLAQSVSSTRPLPVTGTFSVNGSTMAITGGTIATEATLASISGLLAGTLTVDATGQGDVPITLAGEIVTVYPSGGSMPVTGTFDVNGSTLTITGNTTDFATETTLGTLATESTLSTLSNTLSTVSGHVDGIETLLGGTLTVDATGQGDVPITLAGEVVSVVGSTIAVTGGTIAATQSGTWNINTVTAVADITNPVSVYPSGGSLSVTIDTDNVGIGGGTQYAEGATASTATGTVLLAEAAANAFFPLSIDGSRHLQVDIAADSVGVGGGTQVIEGDTSAATTGTVAMGQRTDNTLHALSLDNSDYLNVNIQTDSVGIGGGIQYASGTSPTIPTGTMMMFQGSNDVAQSISSTRPLPVTGTFSVDGSTMTITGGVLDTVTSITNPVDVGGSTIAVTGGTVAATQSGTWDIGTITNDVNIADGGNSITVDNAGGFAVLPTGGTIDTITNPVSVDGSEVTVTGTVTVSAVQSSVQVYSTTHDQTAVNANIQVGDADVGAGNPVPISDNSGSLTVDDGGSSLTVDNAGGFQVLVTGGTLGAVTSITNPVSVAGSTIAVTGSTVAATQSGTWNIGTLTTITNDVNIADGGNSITVDNAGGFSVLPTGGTIDTITNPISVAGSTVAVTGGTYATETTLSTLSDTIATISGHVDGIETTLTNMQYSLESGFNALTSGNITTSGLIGADAAIVAAPGAGNHLSIHHLKGMNHGGEIRFMIRDGAGGTVLGEYTLAASGGGFSEQLRRPINLSSNTALYYDYVSNAYNPDVSVSAIYETLAD